MRILVNEAERTVEAGCTVGAARDRFKPGADLAIVNGFPASPETALREHDLLVLIRRGETPSREELQALMVSRHTPGVHAKVSAARVGVAGLGGLGSQVAAALARIGVGTLTLVDFDVVEPSNLNRQNYTVGQIGRLKVEATGENLRAINPYVKLDLHAVRIVPENVVPLFEGCDVLVEAFDTAEGKAMLAECALTGLTDTPVISASGVAGYGPGETIRVHRLGPRLYVVGDLESEARPFQGLMAPRVGVAAHLQANLALRLLLGEER